MLYSTWGSNHAYRTVTQTVIIACLEARTLSNLLKSHPVQPVLFYLRDFLEGAEAYVLIGSRLHSCMESMPIRVGHGYPNHMLPNLRIPALIVVSRRTFQKIIADSISRSHASAMCGLSTAGRYDIGQCAHHPIEHPDHSRHPKHPRLHQRLTTWNFKPESHQHQVYTSIWRH